MMFNLPFTNTPKSSSPELCSVLESLVSIVGVDMMQVQVLAVDFVEPHVC